MPEKFFSLVFLVCALSAFAFAHRNQGVPLEYVKASYLGKNEKDTLRLEMKFSEPGTISSLRFFTGGLGMFQAFPSIWMLRQITWDFSWRYPKVGLIVWKSCGIPSILKASR